MATNKEPLLARRRDGEAAGPAVKPSAWASRKGRVRLLLCPLTGHTRAKSARPDHPKIIYFLLFIDIAPVAQMDRATDF